MYQYIGNYKVGDSVQYCGKEYRLQEDKGWLFIYPTIDGKRKKIGLEKLGCWFEYGTEADWVFNEWWKIYPDYEVFKQFANNEKLAA